LRITSITDQLRILLVEDSLGDVQLIKRVLNSAMPDAFVLDVAVTLEDALNLLAAHSFDIALLDRSLPDVDGFSGMHCLHNFAPELPIVFLTGNQEERFAFDAIRSGAQDYLLKDGLDGHLLKRAIQYAILRKQFEGIIIMRANYDPLTGLANRTLFQSRLDMARARMKRNDRAFAVLYLDLDSFKTVNEELGLTGADDLLRQFANRLKSAFRPYDTIARLAGDDFVILAEDLANSSAAEVVARKVIGLLDSPFNFHERDISIGVSIGIAICAPGQEITNKTLMKQADAAMHDAKLTPGSFYRTFCSLLSNLAIGSEVEEEAIVTAE
jgi:diguanylate cyclase (GGDEF)-like protein